jgi:hypothetical protein
MLAIDDEVNNVCVPSSDIDAIAKFIKVSGITMPISILRLKHYGGDWLSQAPF